MHFSATGGSERRFNIRFDKQNDKSSRRSDSVGSGRGNVNFRQGRISQSHLQPTVRMVGDAH